MPDGSNECAARLAGERACVVHRASDEPPLLGTLRVMRDLPEPPAEQYVAVMQDIFRADAKAIVDLLVGTLPGGTIDQMLAELCERRALLLRVRR